MIAHEVVPIGSRLQSFQPCGALSWFGKIEITVPINTIIIIYLQLAPPSLSGRSIHLYWKIFSIISHVITEGYVYFCTKMWITGWTFCTLTAEGWLENSVSLIPLFNIFSFVLLPSPVALPVLSFSAFGPFSWPLFSQTSIFRKVGSFVWLLFCFCVQLADEYCSWWYVQHMLPYGTALCIYIVFQFAIVFVHSFFIIFLIWYWNAWSKQSMVPASPNFICHFFMRAIPKGLTLESSLCVLRLYNVHVLYCIPGSPNAYYYMLLVQDLN